MVRGCLNLREGANLCTPHDVYTSQLADARAPLVNESRQEQLSTQLLLLAALSSRIDAATAAARSELMDLLKPGTQLRPTLMDGTPAGLISLPLGSTKARVTDPDALGRWVMTRYPTEVRLHVDVADAFKGKLLAMCEAAGQPCGPGGETGEDAPPGVTVSQTYSGHLVVRPDKEHTAELWSAARNRLVGLTHSGDIEDAQQ